MDFRDLQALRAVVMSGTTKGAALGLGVSQPTISRSITQIESDFGRSIFTRQKGRLVPTSLAIKISERVQAIDAILQTLQKDIIDTNADGLLRIAVTSDSCGEALQRTIRQFRALYPQAEIRLEISDRSGFEGAIADGRLDLGISTSPLVQDGVTVEHLYSCELCCILPDNHRLAPLAALEPGDLEGANMIIVSDKSDVFEQLSQTFLDTQVTFRNKIVVSSARLAYDLVAAGLGIALATPLPFTSGRLDPAIQFRPFTPSIQWRLFSLIAPGSPRHQLARQFCRMFRNVTSSLALPSVHMSASVAGALHEADQSPITGTFGVDGAPAGRDSVCNDYPIAAQHSYLRADPN